ncbi:MAG: TetR/AcrR family transcriptional regulator [Rhodospirillaceae bacterium]|nr:TetR/AcrR family transcriptional regulator [Rhodospirillaceae bacterium]
MRRPYRPKRRAETTAETRRRIVAAVMALHTEQGIAATSMKQIAARADVGIGTVYHHFPTYSEAILACGAQTQEDVPAPDVEMLADAHSRTERVRRLAAVLFAYYQRLPVLEWVRRDRDFDPSLGVFLAAEADNRHRLAARALDFADPGDARVATTAALLDFGTCRALVAGGLTHAAAAERIAEVINVWLDNAAAPDQTDTTTNSRKD